MSAMRTNDGQISADIGQNSRILYTIRQIFLCKTTTPSTFPAAEHAQSHAHCYALGHAPN